MIQDYGATLISDFVKTVLEEPTPDQFLSHIVNKTLASLDARGAILGIIEREGFLDLQGAYGYAEKIVEPFMRIPLWTPLPITDSARSGETLVFITPRDLVDRYPHLGQFGEVEEVVTVSAPIKFRNTVIGAIGFTCKNRPSEDFQNSETTQAIVALCGIYIKSLLQNRLASKNGPPPRFKDLTSRQRQIIILFKEDLTTEQMAERLKYSTSTIKQDIIKIYEIFGVNSRTAVVELAAKAGLT